MLVVCLQVRAELAKQRAHADAHLAHTASAAGAAQGQAEEAHKRAAQATERCDGALARAAAAEAKAQRLRRALEEADAAHKVPLSYVPTSPFFATSSTLFLRCVAGYFKHTLAYACVYDCAKARVQPKKTV